MAKNKRKRNRKRGKGRSRRSLNNRSTPAAMGQTRLVSTPMRSLRIRHREYIQDVTSDGSGEQHSQLSINPGGKFSFPWLSRIAHAFETYKFHSLSYDYVTAVGTSTSGQIALCPDYDPEDNNTGLNKSQMMQFQDTMRTPIWKGGRMKCTRANLQKRKQWYVRDANILLTGDASRAKEYDVLSVNLIVNCASSLTAGELWVNYDVEFFTPQVAPGTAGIEIIAGSSNLNAADEPLSDTTKGNGLASIYTNTQEAVEQFSEYAMKIKKAATFLVQTTVGGTGMSSTNAAVVHDKDFNTITPLDTYSATDSTHAMNTTLFSVSNDDLPAYYYPADTNGATDYTHILNEVDPTLVNYTDL